MDQRPVRHCSIYRHTSHGSQSFNSIWVHIPFCFLSCSPQNSTSCPFVFSKRKGVFGKGQGNNPHSPLLVRSGSAVDSAFCCAQQSGSRPNCLCGIVLYVLPWLVTGSSYLISWPYSLIIKLNLWCGAMELQHGFLF